MQRERLGTQLISHQVRRQLHAGRSDRATAKQTQRLLRELAACVALDVNIQRLPLTTKVSPVRRVVL